MRSSYAQNNYGGLMQEYIKAFRPASFAEVGVLDGYSTAAIAQGIQAIELAERLRGNDRPWAKLDAYDLFDDYEFKHGNQAEVQKMLDERGLSRSVNLQKGNAYEVHKNYPNVEHEPDGTPLLGLEFLHIDISNTGKVIRDLMELWHPKMGRRGFIFIEGGSQERDEIEWMKKYNMPPIKKEIETNPIINKFYEYGTYFRYPSMTILMRKWYVEKE